MAYVVYLGADEVRALKEAAKQCESGRVLYHGLEIASAADEEALDAGRHVAWTLPEHVAWEYRDALDDEGGLVPFPLAGGHIASELLKLYNAITRSEERVSWPSIAAAPAR